MKTKIGKTIPFANWFVLLPALLFLTAAAVSAQQFGNFGYSSDGSSVTITNYTGTDSSVNIPDTIVGLPVTAIGTNAFNGNPWLSDLTIGTNMTSIGDMAFDECGELTSLTLSEGVTNIGASAFANCYLNNLALPDSLVSIGNSAFEANDLGPVSIGSGTASIGAYAFGASYGAVFFTVNTNNPWFCNSANGVLFNKSQTDLVQAPVPISFNASSYSMPNTVTNIEAGAFSAAFLSGLTNITLSINLAHIGANAFNSCVNLSGITFPESLTSIGDYAFADCTLLRSITIPNRVTDIGSSTFINCIRLTSVFFHGNAPTVDGVPGDTDTTVFEGETGTAYYLPGISGWRATFGGWPTALWNPQAQTSGANFGVRTNGFGFNITGTTNIPIVVEASTNLSGAWITLQSASLTNGSFYFSDPQWTNYPNRFYRIRSP